MPPVRSLVSKRTAYCFKLVAIILLLGEIMPTYSRCVLKWLVYITIMAPLGRQPSSYTKCIKSNIRLSCDIKSVSDTKCPFFIYFCVL